MKKTFKELAQQHAAKVWEKDHWRFEYAYQASIQDFIAGFRAAEELFAQTNEKSLLEVLNEAIKDLKEAKHDKNT